MITIYHELGAGYKEPLVQFNVPKPFTAYDVHLRTALNDSGQLSMIFPATNIEAHNLSQMVSEVVVVENSGETWRGRVTDVSAIDYGSIAVTVKGLLDYLYDTTVYPGKFSGTAQQVLNDIIYIHNSKGITDNKKFTLGTINIPGTVEIEVSQNTKTWNVIKSLLSKYNGYIFAHRNLSGTNTIDWIADIDRVCSQDITPGQNQIKLSDECSSGAICTVLYGYGKKTGDTAVSFADINDDKDYIVDDDALSRFGWIEDTYTDTDCESEEQLLEQTQAELSQRLDGIRTITVQAIDRADLRDDIERCSVGLLGHVYVPARGIDATIPIKSVDWYPFEPSKTQISLGASIKLISSTHTGGSVNASN